MPWTDPARADRTDRMARRGGEVLLTLALFATLIAALLPVVRVASPGGWLVGSVALAALVLTAGYAARLQRLPAVAVSLIEAAVWVVFMTAVFLGDTAVLWLIPTPETIREVPLILDQAVKEISQGAAPLDETEALSFLIVGAMGLLTIIVDHVVLTARMPLLAVVGIVTVSLIPAIVVRDDVDVSGFVLLAIAVLALLRAETRSRERPLERSAERAAGVPATAIGVGAVAIVVTLVAAPLLPAPTVVATSGFGPGGGIDATLQLGDDLRRPQPVEVMRVRTSATAAPYLRATTLSRFDGAVWEPDRVRTITLESEFALGTVTVPPDIRVTPYTTTINVLNLTSLWLPVAYPAVDVNGLDGRWAAVPYNRTVIAQAGSTQGQSYEVLTEVPRPTLEQMQALDASVESARDETSELPADLPPIIAELAAQVTASATNDYDRLIALQRWFRGGAFEYSLRAPVEEGFDGSGAEAVAEFLEQREGYCVHFASAFALMARTLGMPTRVVVGYLPGAPTGEVVESEDMYSVTSDLLHAWPEVLFGSVGWIAFEPTVGLGVPTAFAPTALPGNLGSDGATPTPTATPSAQPLDPENLDNLPDGQASGSAASRINPLPALGILLAVVFVLAIPALARALRNRRLVVGARRGDASSAWALAQDAAIDLAIPVPASESPRAFAVRMVTQHGAPPEAMDTLVRAIERASYAPHGSPGAGPNDVMADAALTVRAGLLREADTSRRALALLAPRSLVVRPGSVYAGASGGRP